MRKLVILGGSDAGINKLSSQTMSVSFLSWAISMEKFIWVPFLSPHPKDANYLTVELTVLKEMSQSLADVFALRLPFHVIPLLSNRERSVKRVHNADELQEAGS
jgi:hypothetical protein